MLPLPNVKRLLVVALNVSSIQTALKITNVTKQAIVVCFTANAQVGKNVMPKASAFLFVMESLAPKTKFATKIQANAKLPLLLPAILKRNAVIPLNVAKMMELVLLVGLNYCVKLVKTLRSVAAIMDVLSSVGHNTV